MEARARELQPVATELRKHILRMIQAARSGHPGASLSSADLVTVLYYDELRVRPQDPAWPDRDRFLLSKGHACPVLYGVLAMKGYFAVERLATLREIDGILQGHPDMRRHPGSTSPRARWGTASRSAWAWPWRASSTAGTTART